MAKNLNSESSAPSINDFTPPHASLPPQVKVKNENEGLIQEIDNADDSEKDKELQRVTSYHMLQDQSSGEQSKRKEEDEDIVDNYDDDADFLDQETIDKREMSDLEKTAPV